MKPALEVRALLAAPTPEVIQKPRRTLRVLSSSEKRCFQACKRKHYIRYRLMKRPLMASEPMRFGALVHRGLEAWWRAAQSGKPRLAAALEAIQGDQLDPFELARAAALLTGYDARWGAEAIDVLAVEPTFEAPIINPQTGAASRTYMLGGKINAIVRLADGRVYIVEHKTTSEDIDAASDYWKRLRLDSQVSDYFVGARALGYEVAGCLYDVIGKPKLQRLLATPLEVRKYKKDGSLYANQRDTDETLDEHAARLAAHIAENPDRYYARTTIVRLEEDERDAGFDSWQTAREIREADLAMRHPRNPDACVRYGQTCEYFVVCAREADLEDPTRFRSSRRPNDEAGATPAL